MCTMQHSALQLDIITNPHLHPSSESIRKFEMASASRELQLQNRAARSILTQRDDERHLYYQQQTNDGPLQSCYSE